MTDVVHVASGDIWAGAEAQVAMLARAQAEMGMRVHVVTFCAGELVDRLAKSAIPVDVIDEREGVAHVWRGLRRKLEELAPAVIHAHGYKESILGFTACLGSGIAKVRTLHGVPEVPQGASSTKLWLYDACDRLLASALRVHWIAVSEQIHAHLLARFGRRVRRVANGVSMEAPTRTREQMRAQLGLETSDRADPILLYAGRLEPVKGPDVLIDALPEIVRRFPRAVLLVAGSGSSACALEQQVERLGIQHQVRFLGHRSDVFDLMALADLFVMPSRGEGMPTVLLEAIASGCAVVATDVGAVREVTRDGTLAEVVAPERPDALAAACIRRLSTGASRSAGPSAAATTIADEFSPIRMARETASVYEAALADLGKVPSWRR